MEVILGIMYNQDEGHTNKAPMFTRTSYTFCKVRMKTYLQSLGADVWDIVQGGYEKPPIIITKYHKLDFTYNTKEMNALWLPEPELVKVTDFTNAKAMWDKMRSCYEGNNKVKKAKIKV